MFTKRIIMFLTCLSLTGCNVLQYRNDDKIIGAYSSIEKGGTCTETIIFYANGTYIFRKAPCMIGLMKTAEQESGQWIKKGDTLYLTSAFQNNVTNYFVETGQLENDDSIRITIFSMRTGLPEIDFAFFSQQGYPIEPDNNGIIRIPCYMRTDMEKNIEMNIRVFLQNNDIIRDSLNIQCGKSYHFFIKDCAIRVMNSSPFYIQDTCLFDCIANITYQKVNKKDVLSKNTK